MPNTTSGKTGPRRTVLCHRCDPRRASSSQQDSYYTSINTREFSSSFPTSAQWKFRIEGTNPCMGTALIAFPWERHAEHHHHSQLRRKRTLNAKYRPPFPAPDGLLPTESTYSAGTSHADMQAPSTGPPRTASLHHRRKPQSDHKTKRAAQQRGSRHKLKPTKKTPKLTRIFGNFPSDIIH